MGEYISSGIKRGVIFVGFKWELEKTETNKQQTSQVNKQTNR